MPGDTVGGKSPQDQDKRFVFMLACASFALLAFVLGSGVSCVCGVKDKPHNRFRNRGRFANAVRLFYGNYCIHCARDEAFLKCKHFSQVLRSASTCCDVLPQRLLGKATLLVNKAIKVGPNEPYLQLGLHRSANGWEL